MNRYTAKKLLIQKYPIGAKLRLKEDLDFSDYRKISLFPEDCSIIDYVLPILEVEVSSISMTKTVNGYIKASTYEHDFISINDLEKYYDIIK